MCIFYNLMHTIYFHARLSFNVVRQGENCTANDRDFFTSFSADCFSLFLCNKNVSNSEWSGSDVMMVSHETTKVET